ncbi:hypothetical protein F2Q69_00032420 [Brassica cretica]|uniref:Pex N-terminal domain-containing protein n=1 Tax=Brassica cretica TaxID=69181 RepID=A0A8S9SB35_BRACR|nr:hypothetical protein F2Q69_00032420 [Brassica cretica]
MLVLEGHSLRTTDASFAESLYGLKRKSVRLRLRLSKGSGLEKRQRILSVVFLVVLPYFKSKLHGIYNKEREARLRESIWGEEDQGFDEADFFTGEEPVVSRGDSGDQELSVRVQVATRIKKFVAVCYPWIHTEGLSFTYQLLYLLDATGFYSLGLQALGVQVCRATGQELMDTSSRISKIRNHERERLRGPPWLKTVQGALLSCSYAVLDYAQTGLIAAVFIFKMMEWWYQSAEERMTAPTVYPPPPPPPSPKVAKEGIPLPPDRTLCALCLQKLANPSVVTVSGFVFCYSCVFKYVSQQAWIRLGGCFMTLRDNRFNGFKPNTERFVLNRWFGGGATSVYTGRAKRLPKGRKDEIISEHLEEALTKLSKLKISALGSS